jgi:hypothetical protein
MKWSNIRLAFLSAAGVVILATAVRGEFDPEAWRVVREIKVPEAAEGEHARLALDDDVWDNVQGPSMQDLRLIRGEVEEIGYAIYVPQEPASKILERSARVFNIAKIGGQAAEISLDLGDTPAMTNGVRLETPTKDFGCAVTVEGSNDGESWRTVRSDGAIFDFPAEPHGRFTTISFPDARWRYLRLVVSAPPGKRPIDLTGATVFQEVQASRSELPLMVHHSVKERTETHLNHQTQILLDLGARHLPVSRIIIQTTSENFSRLLHLEVSDDSRVWQDAGRGFIFRFRTDRYREECLKVEFPESFGRYLRVVILDGDNPPLAISGVSVQGRPRYMFFPFQAGKQYRLFYGNPHASGSQYDYPDVFRRVHRRSAIEARLGEPLQNPRFIATAEAPRGYPWAQRNRWVLYLVLALAVAGLGSVAMRALRRADTRKPRQAGGE